MAWLGGQDGETLGPRKLITISIVSHKQIALVDRLLAELVALRTSVALEVIVTLNTAEPVPTHWASFALPLRLLHNTCPKGFAANHNAAFAAAQGRWFCVLNPDIRLPHDPFPVLLAELQRQATALVAPVVLNSSGAIEDSVRRFPTVGSLVRKLFGGDGGRYRFALGGAPFLPDWVAGMFMLFDSTAYRAVGGFDEGFHLYYEDVDICARLWKAGFKVALHPGVSVVHEAQRASRKSPRYMAWHLASMARYFVKHGGRLPRMGLPA